MPHWHVSVAGIRSQSPDIPDGDLNCFEKDLIQSKLFLRRSFGLYPGKKNLISRYIHEVVATNAATSEFTLDGCKTKVYIIESNIIL